MSGRVGDLSDKQTIALQKFKENIKDARKDEHDDHYLLRWLRAREFDVHKSEVMFREAMKWRKEVGADTITKTFKIPELVTKYRTGGFLPGTDKHGCPIFLDPYGQIDMAGILRCHTKQEMLKRFTSLMETATQKCKDLSAKTGKHVEQFLFIYDLKGLGLKHLDRPSVDVYLSSARIAEARYPEILRKVVVVNAPRLFPIVWKIVSPALHESTANKVTVHSDNYQAALFKEVDPEHIPVSYGGTLKDSNGDPKCGEWICYGGPVPEECYNRATPKEGMTSLTVGRGSTEQLEYEVEHPNSFIRYEFCTDSNDVGFGIYKKTSDERQKAGQMETILTSSRVNSHLVTEDGYVECSEKGTYVVRFDNTYSWTRSKTVHYHIEVLEPQYDESRMQTKL